MFFADTKLILSTEIRNLKDSSNSLYFLFVLKKMLLYLIGKNLIPYTMIDTPDLSSYKILIVEDEISNFEFLRLVLTRSGATVFWAKNGEEAVTKYKELPDLDLILMDIRMPILDGNHATKKIRDLGAEIPIIAQTAYATSEDVDRAMQAGCNGFITKPIRRTAFFEMLKKYL